MRSRYWVAALVCVLAGCTKTTPEQQIVNDAAEALGGRARIAAVKTLVVTGEGSNGNMGQDMTMDATSQAFALSGYTRTFDLVNGRGRIEQTRTPNFAYFQGQQPQKQVLGIDKAIGYNVSPTGNWTRTLDAVAKDRRTELYHHPLTIVRAAIDPGAALSQARTSGGERLVDIVVPGGATVTLAIDATSHLPTRTFSTTDNTNLGDVVVETSFADYQDASGLKLPARLTTKTDKYRTAEVRIAKQTVDQEIGDLSWPPLNEGQTAAAPTTPAAPTVTAEEVAPGVWFLAGQSHHSVLVEFQDHLTLIEAPQNDARTLAVIAKVKELRPNKPLTQLVNTHHHFDHSGGIRAAVANGLSVITHKANAKFYEEAVVRPHTIVPDALARDPKPLKVVPVDDELTLSDSTRTVAVYHVAGNPHADTMVMAYLPKERLLVEVDAFSPGSAVQPYAANLLENVKRHNLRVDRIVPLHGTIVPFKELELAVAKASTERKAS